MFHNPEDDDAFEQIRAEGRKRYTAGCWLTRSCPTTDILYCIPRNMEA
jgi:hypothetical protein